MCGAVCGACVDSASALWTLMNSLTLAVDLAYSRDVRFNPNILGDIMNFTIDSPLNIGMVHAMGWVIDDICAKRKIEWVDENTLNGTRIGTLRCIEDTKVEDPRQATVRVTLESGFEHSVLLLDLVNAKQNGGYAFR